MTIFDNVYFNFVCSIIFIILAIGFYNGKLTWLMIYYGCASEEKRSKMPNEKIIRTCWATYLFIALLFLVCSLCIRIQFDLFLMITRIIIAVAFVVLHILTFKWSQVKVK